MHSVVTCHTVLFFFFLFFWGEGGGVRKVSISFFLQLFFRVRWGLITLYIVFPDCFFNKLRNAPCTPPRETPWIVSEGSISNGRSWASLTERESLPILSGKRSRHSRSVKVKGYADQTSVTRAYMVRRTLTVDILPIIGVWDESFLFLSLTF